MERKCFHIPGFAVQMPPTRSSRPRLRYQVRPGSSQLGREFIILRLREASNITSLEKRSLESDSVASVFCVAAPYCSTELSTVPPALMSILSASSARVSAFETGPITKPVLCKLHSSIFEIRNRRTTLTQTLPRVRRCAQRRAKSSIASAKGQSMVGT